MRNLLLLAFVLLSVALRAQVNPQTGGAIFDLPIFKWQDDKSRLNINISANYSSGNGLKVNEIASNMGQGWNMLAGGVITRMVAGEPDDQKPYEGDGTIEDITKYPPGYLYDPKGAHEGCPVALTKYPIFGDQNHVYKQHNTVAADKELDHFAFQMNGRTGIFVLGKSNGDKGEFLGDNKMKVWFERNENNAAQGIRTTIIAFYIQDENGLTYKFANYERTKVMKVHYTDAKGTEKYTQPEFKGGNVYYESSYDEVTFRPYTINSWYLTEIEDALTHRKITFNYITRNITATATGISHYKEKDYSIITRTRSVTQTPVIGAVNMPDGHIVLFNYNASRLDLPDDEALTSVDVKYSGRFLSKYIFTTAYFILNRYGMPASPYQSKSARLCLLSVKKLGVDVKAEEPPYTFDYYLGSGGDDIIPPPFFHMKDVWGYYNGNYSVGADNSAIPVNTPLEELSNTKIRGLCFLRDNSSTIALNAKPGYAKNGLLKKITNPTGGTITYEYAQTYGQINGQQVPAAGVHVSKTLVTDGGYSNDCNNPIITNYSYTLEGSSTSSLWGLEAPKTNMAITNHYDAEYKYFYWKPPFNFGCDWHFKYPGILSREQAISLTSSQQFWVTFSKVMNVVSGVMQIVDIVSLCLKATPAAIVAVILDVLATMFNIIITCTADVEKTETVNVYYNSDLNGSNPLPAQFKRVEITEGSGSNGRTIMEFTSSDDYPLWHVANPSLSMKQRYASWAYGLMKKTTMIDVNGYKVKETENLYNFEEAQNAFICVKCAESYKYNSCKCLVTKSNSQRNVDWEQAVNYNVHTTASTSDLVVDIYHYYSGRVELQATHDRRFKPNSSTQYLETVTEYGYNEYNYQVNSITTTQSNGDKNYKEIRYSVDFSSTLSTFTQNNILNVPITIALSLRKASDQQLYYLDERVTEFTQLPSGDMKPYRTLEQRFKEPRHINQMGFYVYPGAPNNPAYAEPQRFYYDAAGNLIGARDEGNRLMTNIYDYSDKYIVASVVNADPLLDKVAYTSFETASFGGWTLNGTAGYASSFTAVTGSRCFVLSGSNSLSAPLNTAKAYRLSFWSNNNITVNGASLVKSMPVIGGFIYYEYEAPQGTSSVTVSGTGTLDELRLYPASARMRTTTYDPLIGRTSDCDENNRATYLEYDLMGRLQFIKDDLRNVIKMYEYNQSNVKQTAGGCIITYANNEISEDFTKNNCSAGYIGTTVTYTVPAGKYTSTISQAVVDMMAQYELDTYGQSYANTNGSCLQVFCNTVQSQQFTRHCPFGYTGTTVTYTVPACKYTSLISVQDANDKALFEIKANGQAYANLPGNASCVITDVPIWILTGNEYCQGGHRFVEVKDENPNSSTFNQLQWVDKGVDPTCPQYFITQQGSCGGINGTFTLNGTMGDVVVLKLSFSGAISWTGQSGGAGAQVSLSAGGQSCSNFTSHITTMGTQGFSAECTITFTMPASTVSINTGAVIHNSSITSSAGATLRIVSINGNTDNTTQNACYGNSSGAW
jgi:YD repeat-containing protein